MDDSAANDLGIGERIATSRGRSHRTQTVGGRFTASEEKELREAARAEGKLVSEWTRDALLREARTGPRDRAVLTEIVALRMLLNNILRPLALGQQMTAEGYSKILTEVRTGKHAATHEVLTQYATKPQREQ